MRLRQLTAFLVVALLAPVVTHAQQAMPADSFDVRGLPLTELKAEKGTGTLAIFLSGDGGWADIDKQIGKTLAERGVDVIGFDDRAYLMKDHRDPDGTARDVARVARHFMRQWNANRLVLVGYSRGAAFAPLVVNRLAPDVRERLALVAMLGLPLHSSFKYRFSDLWATRTREEDPLILPELEKLRGLNMLCVYGKDEDESLCRGLDPTLATPVAREGKHHFDGDYRAITELILSRLPAAK